MARYAILRHEGSVTFKPGVHWDLMLEGAAAPRTRALEATPAPGVIVAAEQLPDHRLAYLDYEGPISGDRGSVGRWDAGQFELLAESPLALTIALCGERMRGEATLTRRDAESPAWTLAFHPRSA